MFIHEEFRNAAVFRQTPGALRRLLGAACAVALVLTQGCAVLSERMTQGAKPTPAHQTQPAISAVTQADELYSQGRFETARESFKKLTEQYPLNAYFWFRLGNCEAQLKQYPQAVQAFQNAIALDPNDGRFSYNLAFIHGALARDSFDRARTQLPATSPLVKEAEQNRRLIEAAVGPASSARSTQ